MGRVALLVCTVGVLASSVATSATGAQPGARSWAAPQIRAVVEAGLLGESVSGFRPQDPLTAGDLSLAFALLAGPDRGGGDPNRLVTMRELDAALVDLLGLRKEAAAIRRAAAAAGLAPRPWLGTETVARVLGLRVNHERAQEELELQLSEPATRAEAAYSIARVLALGESELDTLRQAAQGFSLPSLTEWQRQVLTPALRLVGSPYVWAGTSEKPQQLFGKTMPGGFDCSGLVWRVYKLDPVTAAAPGLAETLVGRTSFAMSGEVAPSMRIVRDALRPADLVFFGPRGPRSKPSHVGHMGIYVGNGWMVHSSRNGTTLQPLTGWYETSFAWGRRPLAEAGIEPVRLPASR
jgi:cell wall-associated NlpC family hydrolase